MLASILRACRRAGALLLHYETVGAGAVHCTARDPPFLCPCPFVSALLPLKFMGLHTLCITPLATCGPYPPPPFACARSIDLALAFCLLPASLPRDASRDCEPARTMPVQTNFPPLPLHRPLGPAVLHPSALHPVMPACPPPSPPLFCQSVGHTLLLALVHCGRFSCASIHKPLSLCPSASAALTKCGLTWMVADTKKCCCLRRSSLPS